MADEYTEEELDGLTEEERAALEEDDEAGEDEGEQAGDETDTAGNAGGTGDDTGADGGKEQPGDDDGKGGEGEDNAGNPDDPDDGTGGGEEEEEDEGEEAGDGSQHVRQPTPPLVAELPEDAEQRYKEIGEKKNKLVEQFDDGEVTPKEYQESLDQLNREERQIEQSVFKAQIATEMREQQAKERWTNTVNDFLNEHEEYRQGRLRYKALDTAVREIANDEANTDLTGRQILEKAHDQIVEEFGPLGGKEAEKGKGGDKGQQKQRNQKALGDEVPPNLSQLPSASQTETDNSRWSALDRLADSDPERYEAELARLSDAEQEEYLQSR